MTCSDSTPTPPTTIERFGLTAALLDPLEVDQTAPFIEAHVPATRKWGSKRVREWLGFFAHRDLAMVVKTEAGMVVGLALGRPTDDPKKSAKQPYYLVPDGGTIWVDLFIGVVPAAKVLAWNATRRKVGWWDRAIAWNRTGLDRYNVVEADSLAIERRLSL